MSEERYAVLRDSDTENGENDVFLHKASYNGRTRHRWGPYWALHGVLLLASIGFFTASVVRFQQASACFDPIEPLYTREFDSAFKAASQKRSWVLKGVLDEPSEYRGPPNPEVDASWDRITKGGVFSIPEEEIRQMGKLTNSSVRIPAEYGGGYMGSMEAFHQMHCLDLLRKNSYSEYYAVHSESFAGHLAVPKKFRIHLDHCIEMLRQVIMCNADMHAITYNWVDHTTEPWLDFSINRQCRDYDKVVQWMDGAKIKTNLPGGTLQRPEGAQTKKGTHPIG